MKLITRYQKAAKVEALWYQQYSRNTNTWHNPATWPDAKGQTGREIHEGLVALGSFPSPEDVNKVVGNTSWTDIRCDECSKSVEQVVQLGEDPDYESSTAYICIPCLKKAVKLK